MLQPDAFTRRCTSAAYSHLASSPQDQDTQPALRSTSHLSDCQSRAQLVLTQPHGTAPAQARRTSELRTIVSTWGPVSIVSTQGAMGQIRLLLQSSGSGALCCNRQCAGTASPTTSANGGTIRFTARLSRELTIFQSHREPDEGLNRTTECYPVDHRRRAPFGHFPGQPTMYSSSLSSGTSASLAVTRPRTDTPARCTVSGSPDTSGCHHARSLPSATKR